MKKDELKRYLERVAAGEISPDEAADALRVEPFIDMGFAKIDTQRERRVGAPEVIYGAGKTPDQIAAIASRMRDAGQKTILITRMSAESAEAVAKKVPLDYSEIGRVGVVGDLPQTRGGTIAVITAGTSDLPVAEEAAITARALGNRVERLTDVGVAGLHRLLANIGVITRARVVIAIAGMEGALASVVGGLADCPVIAVPTSVGYGASFGGLSALLSMLNSCASGVGVVNIDNGFGAAYLASMINQMPNINENS